MNYAVVSNRPGDEFAEFLSNVAKAKEECPDSSCVAVFIPAETDESPTIYFHGASWRDLALASQFLNFAFIRYEDGADYWDSDDEDTIESEEDIDGEE